MWESHIPVMTVKTVYHYGKVIDCAHSFSLYSLKTIYVSGSSYIQFKHAAGTVLNIKVLSSYYLALFDLIHHLS